MNDAILVVNAGSSSIKLAVYSCDESLPAMWHAHVENIGTDNALLRSYSSEHQTIDSGIDATDHDSALKALFSCIDKQLPGLNLRAAGHRVVHGGIKFTKPVVITPEILLELRKFTTLAPLHQPNNLHAIQSLLNNHSQLKQVACFDTAFHHSMPQKEQQFAIPSELTQAGIRRYGFHGLSYEYIAHTLPEHLGTAADDRVIVAHLGHGASLCAMRQRKSIATTMSFSPLDGIPMTTRSGSIDPSAVIYMQQTMGMSADEIVQTLNYQSGLLGVSGLSSDMRDLLESDNTNARLAVEIFVYQVVRNIGSLIAALGGLDALVFTAGIGENSASIRQQICQGCSWLGIKIDNAANNQNHTCISLPDSAISTWVIPTDEERMIAKHTLQLIPF